MTTMIKMTATVTDMTEMPKTSVRGEVRIMIENGCKSWWVGDMLHREDGPAIECEDGSESWWFMGMPHRDDGPAVINRSTGQKIWYDHGKPGKVEGPSHASLAAKERREILARRALGL